MFIDGVFSGGGIKGFALIGAYDAVQKRGFQFKRVAGTSAGSIVAALIAARYTSDEIYQLVDELDVKKFLDERKTLLPFSVTKWLLLYWRLGLYKGVELENWMAEKLAARDIRTFDDLPPQSLRVIASDLTNGRLVVLPDDLVHYGINPGSFPVAKAIRMSCSLPYFFEPVKLQAYSRSSVI
jgi:NTE family protein